MISWSEEEGTPVRRKPCRAREDIVAGEEVLGGAWEQGRLSPDPGVPGNAWIETQFRDVMVVLFVSRSCEDK